VRFKDNPLVTNPPYVRFYAGAPLVDPDGFALGTIAVVDTKPRSLDSHEESILQDLSVLVMTALENRRRSLLLTQLALTDYLTGVANRAQFDRVLAAEMAHAKRTDEQFSLLCMDLDGFKNINDRFGHPAGDEVLREVARRLQEELRSEDMLSRIGGDEFGIIIRDGSPVSAQILTERITQAMSAPVSLANGDKVDVGISIGMSTYTDAIDSESALLAEADSALYMAKRRAGITR
jgi:diguanylate cyclase (GGDEF)-like protein